MPRKARNTSRGSNLLLRKRMKERKYADALQMHQRDAHLSWRAIAKSMRCSSWELRKRWRRFTAAAAMAHPDALADACRDRRGGSNRVFTAGQEQVLASVVDAADPSMTHSGIQQAALAHFTAVQLEASGAAGLRSIRAFRASDGWVTGFKRRNRLSSHRTHPRQRLAQPLPAEEQENLILQFVHDVRTAIDEYGANRVLNMDETPVPKNDHPISGVVRTGSDGGARATSSAANKLNITHFPTVTAAGNKLQLCAIIKGKTARSLKKITEGASADVRRVRLYLSHKGWANSAVIVQWLRDVVAPHLHGEAGALVMDDYGAHWTEEVQAAAAAMHLQLIRVPPGLTSMYQPLDTGINGPMTKIRQRLWLEARAARPDTLDNDQNAVERCSRAYQKISKDAIISAWRKAYLVD